MLSLLVIVALATAATLEVHTTLPVEVVLDGQPAAQTAGPSTVQLPEVSAGPHRLTIYRGGIPEDLLIELEAQDVLRVFVSGEHITVGGPDDATDRDTRADDAPPVVELVSVDGARFQIQIGTQPVQQLGPEQPLRLDGLAPGTYPIEIRRPDGLVVWVRGSLTLVGGDALRLEVAEGRMVKVFGRPAAWQAGP